MTQHEKKASRNVKHAINWIIGGYYNCIQDGWEEEIPDKKEYLLEEIYDSTINDVYGCGSVAYGAQGDEIKFAGKDFIQSMICDILDSDEDFAEICDVKGWERGCKKEEFACR